MPTSATADIDMPMPLSEIAKRLDVCTAAVYKWRKLGRKNPYTRERVFADFTWMPSGEWGMTREQFDDFLAKLNEKP